MGTSAAGRSALQAGIQFNRAWPGLLWAMAIVYAIQRTARPGSGQR
jgi:hypothetical protein